MVTILDIDEIKGVSGLGQSSDLIIERLKSKFIKEKGESAFLSSEQIIIKQGEYFHIIRNLSGQEGIFYPFSDLESYINL
tara:strand:+ start:261 stop:500 length:240 start_codon:yes stop_codon:yes gene_type:complete